MLILGGGWQSKVAWSVCREKPGYISFQSRGGIMLGGWPIYSSGLLLCFFRKVCGNECTAETVIIIVIIITGAVFLYFFFSACVITIVITIVTGGAVQHNRFIFIFFGVCACRRLSLSVPRECMYPSGWFLSSPSFFFLSWARGPAWLLVPTYIRTYTYFSCSCLV